MLGYAAVGGAFLLLGLFIYLLLKKVTHLSGLVRGLTQERDALKLIVEQKDAQLKLAVNKPDADAVDHSLQSGTF